MISDDDLILYYYRDGQEAAERVRIGAALAEQPELAQRLQKLVNRLDAAAAIPEVDVPAGTLQRWQQTLQALERIPATRELRLRRKPFFTPQLLAAAAVVAAIAVVFQFRQQPTTAAVVQVSEAINVSPYERGLAAHLANTEQQLASLQSASPEERKRLVDAIIEQNRIYALAAEKVGEPQLARVLRAFTPVLQSVQNGGSDTSANLDQLEFELRVMQGRLDGGTAFKTPSNTL